MAFQPKAALTGPRSSRIWTPVGLANGSPQEKTETQASNKMQEQRGRKRALLDHIQGPDRLTLGQVKRPTR